MSESKLTQALLAAQKEMPAVEADAENPHFKSKFVSLGHLIAKTRPVLNKHGLAVAQFPSQNEHGQPTLTTLLMHESGERLEYEAPLFLPKNDPQGQGSAITYMRRYALASALAISAEADDDGNRASQPRAESNGSSVGFASDKQREFFEGLLAKDGGLLPVEVDLVCRYAAATQSGSRGGGISKAIDKLKEAEDAVTIAQGLLANAHKWEEEQAPASEVPADTTGLSDFEPVPDERDPDIEKLPF